MLHLLEYIERVLRVPFPLCDCQSKLKRHIESGSGWSLAVELNAGEVVYRIAAGSDKVEDSL